MADVASGVHRFLASWFNASLLSGVSPDSRLPHGGRGPSNGEMSTLLPHLWTPSDDASHLRGSYVTVSRASDLPFHLAAFFWDGELGARGEHIESQLLC